MENEEEIEKIFEEREQIQFMDPGNNIKFLNVFLQYLLRN